MFCDCLSFISSSWFWIIFHSFFVSFWALTYLMILCCWLFSHWQNLITSVIFFEHLSTNFLRCCKWYLLIWKSEMMSLIIADLSSFRICLIWYDLDYLNSSLYSCCWFCCVLFKRTKSSIVTFWWDNQKCENVTMKETEIKLDWFLYLYTTQFQISFNLASNVWHIIAKKSALTESMLLFFER